MRSESDIAPDAADGLAYAGGIGSMRLRCHVARLGARVVTAKINGHGSSDEDISFTRFLDIFFRGAFGCDSG
jgi:hypothetical protein